MTPQLTSYVGNSCIATPFDRGYTLYVLASRQMWDIYHQNHNLTEAARYTCQPHIKRGCTHKGEGIKLEANVVRESFTEGARFKTPYHEAHYNSKLSARKILPELIIQVDEGIFSPCAFQIQQRKWEKFTNLIQAVGHNMVKEFYANAWEPEKEKRKPYTYTTMVRGKEISFTPQDIKRVLKLRKDPLPNAASYEERVANKDYRLDHVQEDSTLKEENGLVTKMEDLTT
ncbi:hypothetical protein PIB30_094572 [Stylosanthes scabra]|uniref:Putative plant transposon protein domain-containing protein n=1 Tax=Stylosanthes scabra TaxID=79078 RepID=A0ABU6SXX7_9FABA|nr:hypothetical protein [Stylosanthes scabra]